MTSVINHWINGELQPSTSERYGDVFNPATGEVSASADALTSPVAGLNTSPYLSDVDGCNSPLIQ